MKLAHGRVDLVLHDVLQVEIDRQVNLVTVTGGAFRPAIEHDLAAGPVVLDVTIAILAAQVLVHGGFHSLDSSMFKIGEPDDVAKHRSVRINPHGIRTEIDAE